MSRNNRNPDTDAWEGTHDDYESMRYVRDQKKAKILNDTPMTGPMHRRMEVFALDDGAYIGPDSILRNSGGAAVEDLGHPTVSHMHIKGLIRWSPEHKRWYPNW